MELSEWAVARIAPAAMRRSDRLARGCDRTMPAGNPVQVDSDITYWPSTPALSGVMIAASGSGRSSTADRRCHPRGGDGPAAEAAKRDDAAHDSERLLVQAQQPVRAVSAM